MTRQTATRWAVGLLVASLLLNPSAGRVAAAQPPDEPIGGVGSHGWIDGFGMFTRTVWNGRTPVVQTPGRCSRGSVRVDLRRPDAPGLSWAIPGQSRGGVVPGR